MSGKVSWRHALTRSIFTLLLTSFVIPSLAKETVLSDLHRFRPRQLKMAGFVLDSEQTVSVSAIGIRDRREEQDLRLSHAWILNAETRGVVWTLKDADSKKKSKTLREYSDTVDLPKGRYEVYYSSFPMFRNEGADFEYGELRDVISEWWDDIFDRDFDYDDYEDAARDFKIEVRGQGSPLGSAEVREFQASLGGGAIVSSVALMKNHYEAMTLTLKKPMDLQVYAVGELRKESTYDNSWIINTKTRERVWNFNYRNSEPAGGARKNRMFKDTISLPAGEYAVFCVTDDSHDARKWNSAPPYDPYFWGLTIQPADASMQRYATISDYEDVQAKNAIVTFTSLRDDEFESGGFTLKKPMKLRVYAIGEGTGDDMADYSWIIDADTRKTVWKMEYDETDHAGGARKNRMIDDLIELGKGNYIAFATTDDSHSYRRWNAAAPYDRKHWGLTIVVEQGNMRDVAEYAEEEDKNVLAKIVRVGNRAEERERFELSRKTPISIYALGEGSNGRMYDYAWIENARTGKVVWEMSYRQTDHAGGARKNRQFNDMVKLDAGEYFLYYESDGSHSYAHWNASPPADRMNWGVTIRLAKAE
jgi:hypothetical protein